MYLSLKKANCLQSVLQIFCLQRTGVNESTRDHVAD